MLRSWKVLLAAAMVALLVAAVTAAPSGAAGGTALASCTPATNIEAIIDDSGSMAITDENRLRVQAMDLLINTLPEKTTLGAVEFGSAFSNSRLPIRSSRRSRWGRTRGRCGTRLPA